MKNADLYPPTAGCSIGMLGSLEGQEPPYVQGGVLDERRTGPKDPGGRCKDPIVAPCASCYAPSSLRRVYGAVGGGGRWDFV